MRWFLIRHGADGTRIDVADFDSEAAARAALSSYQQQHHPQYGPYGVETRDADATVAEAGPDPSFAVAQLGQQHAVGLSGDAPSDRRRAGLAVAALAVIGALVAGLLFFTGGDSETVASEADPVGTEATPKPDNRPELLPVEPTAAQAPTPTPEAQGTDPVEPTPPPTAVPPTPEPTPEPTVEEVILTQGAGTLEAVVARGVLNCGVSGRAPGFSQLLSDERIEGFDADMCRAVATAILGDADAVNLIPLSAAERFVALQVGDVDLLMRNSTWTQSRDVDFGVDFGPTTFYDGQQLMGRVSDGFTPNSGFTEIGGAIVCVVAGTTTEQVIVNTVDLLGEPVDVFSFEDFGVVTQAFIDGQCDLVTSDGSFMLATKAEQEPADQEWVIFPAAPFTREPLGPIYRDDDPRFADVVNWTVHAMLIADSYGVSQSNVADVLAGGPDGELGRLFGGPGELQSLMGLSPDAYYQVIAQVGSYRDVFNRHLAPLGFTLDGSINDLWFNGGLMYPPPAR